jgi:hypothetical protein
VAREFKARGAGNTYSKFINDFEGMTTNFKEWSRVNPVGIPTTPQKYSSAPLLDILAAKGQLNPQSPNPATDQNTKMSPTLAKQYAEFRKYAANPDNNVVSESNVTGKSPSVLSRIFDVLLRPTYGSAAAFKEVVDQAKQDGNGVTAAESLKIAAKYAIPGVNIISGLVDAATGNNHFDAYWRGVSGKEKIFFNEVLKDAHPNMSSKSRFVTGLALDILTDPLTYVTGGTAGAGKAAVTSLGKGFGTSAVAAETAARTAKGVELAQTTAEAVGKAGQDTVKAILKNLLQSDAKFKGDVNEILKLDLANPSVLADTFFNPLPERLVGSRFGAAGKEARAAVARQQVQLSALLRAVEPGLNATNKFDIYDQLIKDAIAAGKYTDPAYLAQLAKNAFIITKATPEQIAERELLLSRRAQLQLEKNTADKAGKTFTKQSELSSVLTRLDDLDNSTERFIVNIDKEGTLSRFVKQSIKNSKDYKDLEKVRSAFKVGSPEYVKATEDMAKYTSNKLIGELAQHTSDMRFFASFIRGASVSELNSARSIAEKEVADATTKIENLAVRFWARANRRKGSKTLGDVTEQQFFKNASGEANSAKKIAEDKIKLIDESLANRAAGSGKNLTVPEYAVQRGEATIGPWYAQYEKLANANKAIEKQALIDAERMAKESAAAMRGNVAEFLAKEASARGQRAISIGVGWGRNKLNLVTFAVPRALTSSLARAMSNEAISKSVAGFQKAFVSSGRLGSEVKNIRAVMQNQGQSFIEARITLLNEVFRGLDTKARREVFDDLINKTQLSKYPQQVQELENTIKGLAEHFIDRGGIPPINWSDFLNYMPKEFKSVFKSIDAPSINSGEDFLNALTLAVGKAGKGIKDPGELFYRATVAVEQAQLKNLISHELVQQFGIKVDTIGNDMVKTLEGMGYKGVEGFSRYNRLKNVEHSVIFEPEVSQQIAKLQDILQRPGEFINFFDKVQGFWKKTVTVWNPGFFSRSAMGDGFVSYLAGVSGPAGLKAYRESGKVLKAFNQLTGTRGLPAEAFRPGSLDMLANMAKVPDITEKLFTVGSKDLTIRDVWALYIQYVGKTGFASTEFQHLAPQAGMRSSGASRAAQRVGDFGVNVNQGREDYFRLAHFIWKLKQSKGLTEGNLQRFAQEAGEEVRKYHIDYSDFTNMEKTVFARVAPFYKWTRKALPLMLENTLTNPAKISLFPKVMASISAGQGYGDLSQSQEGGFNTRQSDSIIPNWLTNLGKANPLMDTPKGTIFWGPAVPYNDVINTVTNANILYQSTSPVLQAITGASGIGAGGNLLQQTAQLNPLANYLINSTASKGIPFNPTDPSFINFITGLGIQQNTEQRQSQELKYRTSAAKSASKAKKKDVFGFAPNPNSPPLDYRG